MQVKYRSVRVWNIFLYNILLCLSDGRELEKSIRLDYKVNCSSSFQMAQLLGQGGSTASLVSHF